MPSNGFDLQFEVFRRLFVDPIAVQRRLYSRNKRAFSGIGAILMRSARKSIKKRAPTKGQRERLAAARESGDQQRVDRLLATLAKKRREASPAGGPPYSRVDHPVSSIRAIYFAADEDGVIVGPVKARRGLQGSSAKTVPELLEFGGTATIGDRRVRYRKRPFMNPALRRESPKSAEILAAAFGGR